MMQPVLAASQHRRCVRTLVLEVSPVGAISHPVIPHLLGDSAMLVLGATGVV